MYAPKILYHADNAKFETGADTDDADPYVCFRRREVRQIRKTRGRDAHSAEKLKKLRKELEEARELFAMIKQREIWKREQLVVDRTLFDQRDNLISVKQNLPDQYKEGDEDLLITQKVKTAMTKMRVAELTTRAAKEKGLGYYSAFTKWSTPVTQKIGWQVCRSRPAGSV